MSHSGEKIAASLKAARQRKGLSQRELSRRAGVPQSHISKIEQNGVDLRVSSLAALASALDLELTLVPRKATPAVNAILRSISNAEPFSDMPDFNLSESDGGLFVRRPAPLTGSDLPPRPACSLYEDDSDD